MNRRSFLKRLGLLAVVPFVPISALKYFTENPDVPYRCYKSNAQNLAQLFSQVRALRKHGLLQLGSPGVKDKTYGIISVETRYWEKIQLELHPSNRWLDVELAKKGFDNFIVKGVPILGRG